MFDPFKKLAGIETKTEKKEREAREAKERQEREAWEARKRQEREQAIKAGVNPDSVEMLSGHSGGVTALTLLSDGRLASGSGDKTIKLWNVLSGSCEVTLSGHSSSVRTLTLLSDGRLVSGGGDNTIKLWNVSSGKCEHTLSGHGGSVLALTLLSDGRLASGGSDKMIKLWNVSSGACEVTLSGHSDSVWFLTLLSDGRLASGSGDWTIKLWNVLSGLCESTLSGHSDIVRVLTLLPDGRLASGSSDKTIKLWNVSSGACEVTLSGHSGYVLALTVLSDGRLASGSFDNTIKLWNVSSGACEVTLFGHGGGGLFSIGVPALTLLSDGRLASGGSDKRIKLWNVGQTLNLRQPIAATPGERLESSKNEQKDKNLIEEEKAKKAQEVARRKVEQVRIAKEKAEQEERDRKEREAKAEQEAKKRAQEQKAREEKEAAEARKKTEQEAAKKQEQENREAALVRREQELQARENQLGLASLTIIPSSELTLQRELGRGGYGVVWEARWKKSTPVAAKQLIGELNTELVAEFKREAEVHARLRHPNIIALYGVCLEPMKYMIVMELMSQGSLCKVLHSTVELPWSQRLLVAQDIASALLYLHTENIIHRDIKSLNILLDERMRAKVSDFGLAKIKYTTSTMTKGGMGTPHWMAPELFDDEGVCNKTTDIYATGIVFWEMAARKLPYEGKNTMQIMRSVVDKGNRESIPAGTPEKFAQLISQCWAQRAEDRPTVQTIAAALASEQVGANAASEIPTTVFSSGYQAFSR